MNGAGPESTRRDSRDGEVVVVRRALSLPRAVPEQVSPGRAGPPLGEPPIDAGFVVRFSRRSNRPLLVSCATARALVGNLLLATEGEVGCGAVLTSSLGGNFGTVSTHSTYIPSTDRIVWGATSGSGQGGTVWNQLSVNTVVPEPAAALLGSIGIVLLLRRRRQASSGW